MHHQHCRSRQPGGTPPPRRCVASLLEQDAQIAGGHRIAVLVRLHEGKLGWRRILGRAGGMTIPEGCVLGLDARYHSVSPPRRSMSHTPLASAASASTPASTSVTGHVSPPGRLAGLGCLPAAPLGFVALEVTGGDGFVVGFGCVRGRAASHGVGSAPAESPGASYRRCARALLTSVGRRSRRRAGRAPPGSGAPRLRSAVHSDHRSGPG